MQYRIVGLLLSVALIIGCSQTQYSNEKKESQLAISSVQDAPFYYSDGAKFAIVPKFVTSNIITAEQEQALYGVVTLYVEQEFKARGFKFVSTEQDPDFVVKFAVALSEDLTDEKISEHFGVTPGLSNKEAFEKASFLIAVDDGQTSQRLWRGAAQGFAQESVKTDARNSRLKHVIEKVLIQFDTKG